MADHAQMTLTMSLALDGMLSAEERAAFEAHVHACPDCWAEWKRWQQVDRFLAEAPMLAPAPGFSGRVLEQLSRRQRRQRRLVGGVLLLGGSLSVGVLTLLVLIALVLLWALHMPALIIQGVRVLLEMAMAGGLLLKAMRLWLQSVVSPPLLPWLVTYICVMNALIALWGWLVQRRSRRAPTLPILVSSLPSAFGSTIWTP